MLISVLQVYPTPDYKVYIYFSDGKIKLYDVSPLLEKGVFHILKDKDFYINRCTVLNNTLAWDVTGDYDPSQCLDLDPIVLYREGIEVDDPLDTPLAS